MAYFIHCMLLIVNYIVYCIVYIVYCIVYIVHFTYLLVSNVLSSLISPGPTCEEAVDPCELLDCMNGGECIKLGDTASCSCPMGYEGSFALYSCDIANHSFVTSKHVPVIDL